MKQKPSHVKPITTIHNNNSNEQVIAEIYFPTDSDTIDMQDKTVLNNLCANLKTLDLKVGCFGDVWVVGGADHRGSANHNMNLGVRRAEAVRKHIQAQGFNGRRLDASSVGNTHAAKPTKHRSVSAAQLAKDRRVDVILVLSIDKKRVEALEKRKQEVLKLLEEAKDWEIIRGVGYLSVVLPGDNTIKGMTGIVNWVKPKEGPSKNELGAALKATAKTPLAAVAIMASTFPLMLSDSIISHFQVARRALLMAPPGAYLAVGEERKLHNQLAEIQKEIDDILACQVRVRS